MVGTKADRLSNNVLAKSVAALKRELEVDEVLAVSAKTDAGTKALWGRLMAVAGWSTLPQLYPKSSNEGLKFELRFRAGVWLLACGVGFQLFLELFLLGAGEPEDAVGWAFAGEEAGGGGEPGAAEGVVGREDGGGCGVEGFDGGEVGEGEVVRGPLAGVERGC